MGHCGCCSIQQDEVSIPPDLLPPDQQEIRQWLRRNLKQHVVEGSWPKNVPHLSLQLTEGTHFKLISRVNSRDARAVWKNLIERLGSFRQMRRESQKLRFGGRSIWPEPSTIRYLTGQSHENYASPIPNPPLYKFPRAAFGLPIIFKFKDNKEYNPNNRHSDPRKTVLQMQEFDRFASPLILKPLACQKEEFIGLALILEGTRLGKEPLVLKAQEGNQDSWDSRKVKANLDPGEVLILNGSNPPIRIDSQTDVLQAFMKYL